MQAVQEYEAVRLELELFNPALAYKPFVVAYNKMDIPEAAEQWLTFKETLKSQGVDAFSMSAATKEGTMDVIVAAYQLLQSQKNMSFDGGQAFWYQSFQ